MDRNRNRIHQSRTLGVITTTGRFTSPVINGTFPNFSIVGNILYDKVTDKVYVYNGSIFSPLNDPSVNYGYTQVNTASYTATVSDEILGILYTTVAPVTITLPKISTLNTPNHYKIYTITDEGGNVTTNNITINAAQGDQIQNSSNFVITGSGGNFDGVTFYNNGTDTWYRRL